MTLKDIPINERRKLVRSYPVLISSFPNAGKSAAVEDLEPEDKMRTAIIDIEGKGLPNDFDDEYFRIIRLKPVTITPGKEKMYEDYDNVKYKTLPELKVYIPALIAHESVDRVIIDSFTQLVDTAEKYYVSVSNGFTVWKLYNEELYDWFCLLKEETRFNGKFVYVLGHYKPAKDAKDTESEKFTQVKGREFYRMVESHYNTVLTIEDHKFIADNDNVYDSTRINKHLSPFESELNSLKELELKLTSINK